MTVIVELFAVLAGFGVAHVQGAVKCAGREMETDSVSIDAEEVRAREAVLTERLARAEARVVEVEGERRGERRELREDFEVMERVVAEMEEELAATLGREGVEERADVPRLEVEVMELRREVEGRDGDLARLREEMVLKVSEAAEAEADTVAGQVEVDR